MGPGTIVKLIEHDKESFENFSIKEVSMFFAHSVALGLILTLVTIFVAKKIAGPGIEKKKKNKIIMGCTNILFITVGITALMTLASNNLARAFAIGACMSIIRFRVSIGPKALSSNLLFAITVGVACGVQMIEIAWILTGIYTVIQLSMLALMAKTSSGELLLDEDEKVEM